MKFWLRKKNLNIQLKKTHKSSEIDKIWKQIKEYSPKDP